jgi:trehalose-6-phosphatase
VVYCIDIDGTLCTASPDNDYSRALPYPKRISRVNVLYAEGHTVILWTGRHWNNLKLTVQQLVAWGVNYHSLAHGKPPADIYIDDRAINDIDYFGEKS